jgi:cytoskeleton-associated protein 5
VDIERLRRENEHLRLEKGRGLSQIHELTNQNAQLIEDHTRDVLSIKAKETQLVRARSDEEEARQSLAHAQRDVDRLKRELSRQMRASSPPPQEYSRQISRNDDGERDRDNERDMPPQRDTYGTNGRQRSYVTSPTDSIGKENSYDQPRSKLTSPQLGATASFGSSGSQSPNRRSALSANGMNGGGGGGAMGGAEERREGQESWRRAAEVTQNLKARIEMMKVSLLPNFLLEMR